MERLERGLVRRQRDGSVLWGDDTDEKMLARQDSPQVTGKLGSWDVVCDYLPFP